MAAEPKTKRTGESVTAFINAVENDTRRADAKIILKLMKDATGEKAEMWGPSIIGFGAYKTPTGDWPRLGFSPRKANLVLYLSSDFPQYPALMKRLGKHKTSVACLYINKLSDVDMGVLGELITRSVAWMRQKHG
jgi:hypothetical protein